MLVHIMTTPTMMTGAGAGNLSSSKEFWSTRSRLPAEQPSPCPVGIPNPPFTYLHAHKAAARLSMLKGALASTGIYRCVSAAVQLKFTATLALTQWRLRLRKAPP
ncbi:hypothetical protein D3C71_1564960 [compost metagenome]